MSAKIRFFLMLGCLTVISLFNCRGEFSDEPPININPNMDFQPKEKAQDKARPIPEGTVAFGEEADVYAGVPQGKFLQEDESVYTGKSPNGQFLSSIPLPVDMKLLKRGQSRFNIYCAACHDQAGTSQSILVRRGVGIPPPPDLAAENLLTMPDGQIFNSIKYGIRNMPGYGTQIEADDIWAVVAYVRAIQASRTAQENQVPADVRVHLRAQTNK